MSDQAEVAGADDVRVDELLRINAELAAEIRSLRAGRVEEPRSMAMPSARRVSRLVEELEGKVAELESVRAELRRTEEHNRELGQHIHNLSLEYDELAARFNAQQGSLKQLRTGLRGLGRAVRARLGGLRKEPRA